MSTARLAATATRASSAAMQVSMLRRQQVLQQEELRIQQRKEELVLETKLAQMPPSAAESQMIINSCSSRFAELY